MKKSYRCHCNYKSKYNYFYEVLNLLIIIAEETKNNFTYFYFFPLKI